MATWTSQRSGTWSVTSDIAASPWYDGGAQTALATIPANTDTVTIANTHDVAFDVDQSGFAAGITLTIASGGTLHASTTAGTYYLKCQANLTVNGILQAGTSAAVPYPATCTFTIYMNGAYIINVSSTGRVYLYCVEPTKKWTTMTNAEIDTATEIEVNDNLTGDIWASGDTIAICNIHDGSDGTFTAHVDTDTLNGAPAADHIHLTTGLSGAKNAGSYIALLDRNIVISGGSGTGYILTFATTSTGNAIYAEILPSCNGIRYLYSSTLGGVIYLTGANVAIRESFNDTVSCVIVAPLGSATLYNTFNTFSGLIAGCVTGLQETGSTLLAVGVVAGCGTGFSNVACSTLGTIIGNNANICSGDTIITGNITKCHYGLNVSTNFIASNCTLNNAHNLNGCRAGKLYNVAFTGTEFLFYNDPAYRFIPSYVESLDHDQVVNAFKAWCLGGIVTSQTASPPTGYEIWYEHACEDTAVEYPCFRQYETTVLPGTAIEVVGKIRIADAEDFTTAGDIPPRLQIIDKFADPLIDATQSPLDEDIIGSYDGTNIDWQDVDVIWANQGDAARQVIIRMLCYSDQAGATDIDEVWAIATYQDQIQTLYNTLVPDTGETTANGNADGTTVIDTNRTEGNDYWNGMSLQISNGSYAGQTKTIKDWDLATGTFTVSPAFSGQIVSGVDYKIITAALYQPGIVVVPFYPPTTVAGMYSSPIGMTIITNNGSPAIYDITPGIVTIGRIRGGAYTEIVSGAACSESGGTIYYNYDFPVASWQEGDVYYIYFSLQSVLVNGISYPFSAIRLYGQITSSTSLSEVNKRIKRLAPGGEI